MGTHVEINNPTVRSAEHFIRMVGMKDLLGLVLIGPAGMGKTHMVEHILTEMNEPYVKYGGHITLPSIYEYLCENSNNLVFFDDCSQLVQNTEIMEILKQALQVSKERVLHYRSFGLKSKAPKSFVFEGRIIMAFNTMDVSNPNVQAIISRAPMIELAYSREEIYQAMYKIARGEGGGLLEHEKMWVTKEIENHTRKDARISVNLRKQQIAFQIYASFKRLYGEGNTDWIVEVHNALGKVQESWIQSMVKELVGESGRIPRLELARAIAGKRDTSLRTAYRKIAEALELEQIFTNKETSGDISLLQFK
jgi:hypothetical protein